MSVQEIIIQAGIKKIYYLMDDKPKKLYMRCSRELLKRAGYQIDRQGWPEVFASSPNQK
jgi:deoxycytidylate deaminase